MTHYFGTISLIKNLFKLNIQFRNEFMFCSEASLKINLGLHDNYCKESLCTSGLLYLTAIKHKLCLTITRNTGLANKTEMLFPLFSVQGVAFYNVF